MKGAAPLLLLLLTLEAMAQPSIEALSGEMSAVKGKIGKLEQKIDGLEQAVRHNKFPYDIYESKSEAREALKGLKEE